MTPAVEFGAVLCSADGLARMPEPYPAGLGFLAFPGEAFESQELRMKLHKVVSGKVAVMPRELLAYEMISLLPEQNLALKIEFARVFRARCKRALELRSGEVGLRIDWERMQAEEGYRDALRQLLRGTFGILDEFHLKLRLALRLPGNAAAYMRFLREMQFPGLVFSLECTPGAVETDALHTLRFYSDFFALHPDPETGRGWSVDEIRKLAGEAGTLCVSPRRFGIVTDDVPAAAVLAEEFRRPAVVPEENREVKSC